MTVQVFARRPLSRRRAPEHTVTRGQMSPLWRLSAWTVMIGFSLFTVLPMLWMGWTAFKTHREIARDILSFPTSPTFENFTRAWSLGNFDILTLNSIFYSFTTTFFTVLLSLAIAYAFCRIPSRLTRWLSSFVLLGLLLTVHSTLIPLFLIANRVGLTNSHLGILLPYIAFSLPFAIYLATVFMRDIPDEIFDAAVMDGASHLHVFFRIVIPLSAPIIATISIFTFMNSWNEFVLVFTLTSETAVQTLPIGINALAGGRNPNYGLQFASLALGTVPMILFYLLFQKQLHKGFAGGAVKG